MAEKTTPPVNGEQEEATSAPEPKKPEKKTPRADRPGKADPVTTSVPPKKKEKAKSKNKTGLKEDCRLCIHYMFSHGPITTHLAAMMEKATDHYTRTYCGTQPHKKDKMIDARLTCIEKTFTPLKSAHKDD